MSVYSTPTTKTCFDEGSSPCSNQSFYFTPRETHFYLTPQSRSRKRATPYKGKVPKFNVYDEELARSEENSTKDNDLVRVSTPISTRGSNKWVRENANSSKETIISIDKENIGVRFCSTPSLPFKEKSDGFIPLSNISNQQKENATVFEARISSVGKHFDLRIRTEANVDQPTKCNIVQNSPNLTSLTSNKEALINVAGKGTNRVTRNCSTLFRGLGIGRKLRRKSVKNNPRSAQKADTMIDTPIQSEVNLVYLSKDVENTDIPRVRDEQLHTKNEISIPDKQLLNSSRTPLLVDKKTPPRNVRFWQFIKIRKFRLSPVKRLLFKPSKYLVSFKEKIIERFSFHPIKTLLDVESEDVSRVSSEVIPAQTHQICTLCLENLSNKEEIMSKALSALMTKLTSMEDELKEIKGLVKHNAIGAASTTRKAPLPPPPPPPPPPNFLNTSQSTGTLKRKADLTTPENVNHVVKRPAIKNERTQFSITVEDIRNVKLRKTPAHVFKPREPKESNTVNGDEGIRSSKIKKNRIGSTNGKKRTQSLAELSSRENVTINRDPINDSSNLFTPQHKEDLSTVSILEETPVTSKTISTNNRSQKRKEWLIESPVRKRINTGNSSNIYRNAEPEL